MATITLKVNNEVKQANERVLNVLACVMGTDNPFSDTVTKGILETGKVKDSAQNSPDSVLERAMAYAQTFAQAGSPDDVFEITQVMSKGNATAPKIMRFTREQIAGRFDLNFNRSKYQGEIINPVWDSTATGNKSEKSLPDMDVF